MRFKLGGNCVVDSAANQIMIRNSSSEQITRVEPRIMHVLVLLAEQPGEVLTREFLIDTVWQNKFVGEEGLTQAISTLRKVFGDKAHKPDFIETIPKRGYRLIADIERNDVEKIPGINGSRPQSNSNHLRTFAISSIAVTGVFLAAMFLIHHF